MSVLTLAALLLPTLAVYAALRRPWRSGDPPLSRAVAVCLSPSLGLGLASCVYFLLLLTKLRQPAAIRTDVAVWLSVLCVLAVDAWRRRALSPADIDQGDGTRAGESRPAAAPPAAATPAPTRNSTPDRRHGRTTDRVALAAAALGALVLLGVAARAFWLHAGLHPHGEWDAWAIWNLRARALLRGAPDWASIFSSQLAWSNVDYPLLLPLTVARLWAFEGAERTIVPAVVAFTFFASTVATVSVLVGQARGWVSGLLSGAALVAPYTYVFQGSCQCADVPLAQYVLVAVASGAMARQAGATGSLIAVAGTAAGLAAWTKNEGQVLLVLMLVSIVTWPRGERWRSWRWFGAGAAVPLGALLWFKLRLAPDNYLFTPGSLAGLVERLRDADRWTLIRAHLGTLVPSWGETPGGALLILGIVVLLTARVDRRALPRAAFGLAVLGVTASGYVFVYAITPLPLEWQILTSFPRLMVQLWPALVWTVFQVSAAGVAPRLEDRGPSAPVTPSGDRPIYQASVAASDHGGPPSAWRASTMGLVDLVTLGGGMAVVLAALLTRSWGIHVDEILYFGYAIGAPLGDALIVGNHFLIYAFNYGLYHALSWVLPPLAPLILPVFYALATVSVLWWLAIAMSGDTKSRRLAFALLLLSPFVLFNATQVMLETALVPLIGAVFASALILWHAGTSARRVAALGVLAALCVLTKATALPALALLTVGLWPLLGVRVWPLLAGAAAGAAINQAGLALLHAPSASYGGVGQLVASIRDLSIDRLLETVAVWAFFAGPLAFGAVWCWRERRDRLALSLLAAAALSAPAAILVQLSTDPALPFPRYAYPVIWVGVAAGGLACARSRSRWLAPVVLALHLPLSTALWPGVFPTMSLWPSIVVREAFQNGGTILSGAPVHGWVAMSGGERERLCVYLPRDSPGALQAEPWFSYVAKEVSFFDAAQTAEFRQCTGAKAVFDRRFDVDPCALDVCTPARYRIRSCLPQHIAFYAPRFGDVQTRVCLP